MEAALPDAGLAVPGETPTARPGSRSGSDRLNRVEDEENAYLLKAAESLESAESDFANGRYNSCANRSYYACFQAAVAALIRDGIRPSKQWGHAFVQSQLAGVLIDRRKRYPSELRRVLRDLFNLREVADYQPKRVTRTQAQRALEQARLLLGAIQGGGRR